jgi:hypothetical protein
VKQEKPLKAGVFAHKRESRRLLFQTKAEKNGNARK